MLFKPSPILFGILFSTLAVTTQATGLDSIELPDMGDSSGTLISPIEEQELGAAFFRNLHTRVNISQDAEIQQYIQSIGNQLVSNSDLPASPFHFFVVLDNQINAFAGPGGYIGINSGLLLLTESESELASVMAHEVAHVTQRHLYRAFEAASRLSIPTAAATLAAILIGTQSPALGQAALIAIQAGSVQFQINFTRDNEKEADRVGMQTLAKSEYNPRSMPIFFERLQQSSRYYGKDIPEFLRTHPVSASRISDTRGRANKYPYKQYPNTYDYQLAQAKLRVMMADDKKIALTYFKTREHQGTKRQQAVTQYGIGQIHLANQNFNKAKSIFKKLAKSYPNQSQYVYALAKTLLEAQHYQAALALLTKAAKHFSTNNAIKIEYISTLLKTKHSDKAKTVLQSLNYEMKKRPLYYELMAKASANLKQPAESHRYLAEYYYASGNTETAILQIKLAKKAKNINFYLQAILNERLAFFLNEEIERKLNR